MKTPAFWQRRLQKAHICSWYDYATQLIMSEEAVCLDYDEQFEREQTGMPAFIVLQLARDDEYA